MPSGGPKKGDADLWNRTSSRSPSRSPRSSPPSPVAGSRLPEPEPGHAETDQLSVTVRTVGSTCRIQAANLQRRLQQRQPPFRERVGAAAQGRYRVTARYRPADSGSGSEHDRRTADVEERGESAHHQDK